MLFEPSFDAAFGETRIDVSSNCYSDAMPLLRRLCFRRLSVDLQSQSLALALAVLAGRYCGEIFEVTGVRVGGDYAQAIRRLISFEESNVAHVDGMKRSLATGELDVAVARASLSSVGLEAQGGVPLARIDWSGDFVDARTRTSQGFVYGGVQTNAAYFASSLRVSIAVGILFGRDRMRELAVVLDDNDNRSEIGALASALRTTGIELRILGNQS
jgi:hypothetical protein